MKKINGIFLVTLASLLLMTGCAKQQTLEPIEQFCTTNLDKPQAMQTAQLTLSSLNFTIDKVDSETGVIKTKPLPAAQFFEFWRKDNVGSFNSSEANLQNIRRIAQVNIVQQDAQICFNCTVKTQRLHLSDSGDSQTYKVIQRNKRSIQRLKLEAAQKKWIDLDNDPHLASEILKQIEQKIEKTK